MEEQTRKLLEECSAGCKMAINSIDQIKEYVTNEKLAKIIDTYRGKQVKFEAEAAQLLEDAGRDEKEPGAVASAVSWFTTEVKLMMKDDSSQIAKLLMDGCNMGIKEIGKYINQYAGASRESLGLAKKLVKSQEEMMKELEAYL